MKHDPDREGSEPDVGWPDVPNLRGVVNPLGSLTVPIRLLDSGTSTTDGGARCNKSRHHRACANARGAHGRGHVLL